ncbi:MAG: glucokinase [Rhodocyclaceae bacterium]
MTSLPSDPASDLAPASAPAHASTSSPSVLVGDIGGTNARFALSAGPGAHPTHVRSLACADYAGPDEALHAYFALEGLAPPRVAAIGIANPVTGDTVKMTNHHWRFSVESLRAAIGFERLLLVNDFTALALALQDLRPDEYRQVGGGLAQPGKPIGLIGPGTGLGVSGLVPAGGTHAPLEGEGGHVTLATRNAREARVVAVLAKRFGHVSAERVLSGAGLVALHDALRQLDGAPALALADADISARGLAGACPYCVETLHLFCALLGSVAGDLALTLGALGGVHIGGGIVPRLGEFFERSEFRRRFEDKGRFRPYLARIPTFVIHAAHPALLGAARALAVPLSSAHDARAPAAATAAAHDDSPPPATDLAHHRP